MDLFLSLQINGVKVLIDQRAGGRVGRGAGKGFQLTCCVRPLVQCSVPKGKCAETLIADSVTMVMCRLLSVARGLNGLEAPFQMLASEEVAKCV